MKTDDLKQWIELNQIHKKTTDGFWTAFNNYLIEEQEECRQMFGEFDKNKLELKLDSYSLMVHSSRGEFVQMTLDMNYSDQYIGYYKMMFDFNGEVIDDFLVSEWKTWEIYRRISILEEIKNEIKNEELIHIIDMKIQETKKEF